MRLRERHADDLGCACHTQGDGLRLGHIGLLVIDGAAGRVGRAADINDELRDAFDVLDGLGRVYAALKTMTCIGRKIEAA